jgi:transcriptional regulator with GAF, ATPase, and Fis domain
LPVPSLSSLGPDGVRRVLSLVKRVTSIGRHPDNDFRLEDPSVPEHALTLLCDGNSWRAGAVDAPFLVDGKRRDGQLLTEGMSLQVGDTELTFNSVAPEPVAPPSDAPGVLRRLIRFSATLLQSRDADALLEALLDEAVALTGADRAVLLVLQESQLTVRAARNVAGQSLPDARQQLSETILTKVLRSCEPLLVQNALADPEFSASESVVNLQLSSVMCVPLGDRPPPFGLLYLGTDRFRGGFDADALDLLTIFAAQASLLLQNAQLLDELRLDVRELRDRLEHQRYGELVGACAGMRDVYRRVDKVAPTDITVLLQGETGTGKELIAREIHLRSPRSAGPFMVLNCGAIPETLLETELFGHVRGAFTGAVASRPGRFQAASGGTLFLDEVGEMTPALQVKLLRALDEKQVTRVGETRPEAVDIRVVAATHRVLEDEVRRGGFREDLYYRLNTLSIRLPPLRERGDDVLVLARYFLAIFTAEYKSRARGFSPQALAALRKHAWPGNVRELKNRIQRAVVLAERPVLRPDDLELPGEEAVSVLPLAQAREEFQRRYIEQVLERNGGNRTRAARELGVDPRTVFRFLEKLEAERDGKGLPADPADEELT